MKTNDHPLLFGRFAILNGLRAVTLFWVMFVHLPSFAVPSILQTAHDHFRFGVDFFFAISGFLVTRSLYQCVKLQNHLGRGIGEFLVRRVARIAPPYYFTLALTGLIAIIAKGGLADSLWDIRHILPSWPLFFANFTMASRLEQIPHTLLILWSVSFQEQFYFLLALYFYISQNTAKENRFKNLLLFTSLASLTLRLAAAFIFWKDQDRAAYYEFWLPFNFDGIGWGCLAWLYYDELRVFWKGRVRSLFTNIGLLVGLGFCVGASTIWGEQDRLQVVIMCLKAPLLALLVRSICEFEGSLSLIPRILKSKILGEIGIASFEVYLIHVLLYGFLEKAHISSGVVYLAFAYGFSLSLGVAFYNYFGKVSQEKSKAILMRWFRLTRASKSPRQGAAAA